MQRHVTAIVGLNSQYIHSSLAPWCLLAGVRAYTAETAFVVEGTINETDDVLLSRLRESSADVFCFCCYIWNITTVLRLAEVLKTELPTRRIVLGGPEVGYRAQDVLTRYPFVDAVISGAGEWPLARLLEVYADGQCGAGLDGVSVRGHIAEPYLTDGVPPSPYLPDYFEQLKGRIAYIETSRGCPYSCAFCLSGRCGGVRYFPEERCFEELIALANSGTSTIKFVDRTFNADRGRALRYWRFIVDNYGTRIPAGVCFHFEIAGDLLNEEALTVLNEAPRGLFQLEIGLQSFRAETLAAVCRRTDMDALIGNIRKLTACDNVTVHLDLIAGLPEEGLDSFLRGLVTAVSLRPQQVHLGFLKRLHGSPLAAQPDRYPGEFSAEPPYEVQYTPSVTAEQLHYLHTVERGVNLLYNSGRFRRTLTALEEHGADLVAMFEAVGRLADTKTPADAVAAYLWDTYEAVRESLLTDRVATNPAGTLPAALDTDPVTRRRLKRLLDTDGRRRRPQDTRRGTALLPDGTLVFADAADRHPVTGEYRVGFFREEQLARKRRFLLFDLDGTITDPAVGITRSVQHALRHFGIDEPDLKKLEKFIGPPLVDAFTEFYGIPREKGREALAAYREYYADTGLYEAELYAGIAALLQRARRSGYEVVMATSKPEMYARRLMRHFGLDGAFSEIVGADMAERRASKTAVIQEAMARLAITDPSEAMMIGDRRFDVESGRALGMETVGVLYGYGSYEELSAAGADHLVATVRALDELLF